MDQSSMDSTARIDELEARVAQQDQSITELSEEVFKQQQQIAALEIKTRYLTERLQSLASSEPVSDSEDEVPPHY